MTESAAIQRFRSLYETHRRDVLAYFRRRVGVESADDCTDEVFLTVWRRLDDVPKGQDARPWLFGVAHHVLSNHQRAGRRRRRLIGRLWTQPTQAQAGPETEVMRRAARRSVNEVLEQLSHGDREILRLAYWEELPHDEIGRVLGCSTGAVAVRLHRATRRLGKGLERTGHVSNGRRAVLPDQGGETC